MNIIGDVLRELVGMFLADARLTLTTLSLVAAVAGLVAVLQIGPLVAGGILIFGCLATLVEAVGREARQTGRR